jgi:hypothetical protein
MFDRLFMPALTFTLLVAGLAAFSSEIVVGVQTPPQIVQLERVVVGAPRELPATPVARADTEQPATVAVH